MANPLPGNINWLIMQCVDYYRDAQRQRYTPSTRERKLRRFEALVEQLLPLIGKDALLRKFCAPDLQCGQAHDTIKKLAEKPKAPDILAEVRLLLGEALKLLAEVKA